MATILTHQDCLNTADPQLSMTHDPLPSTDPSLPAAIQASETQLQMELYIQVPKKFFTV